ncbi:MAG TPA: nucleotidyltransferase domain-containing protein [Mycobacteriales bacterium]|nr:nucleotidyltransferase domain-containing protein [Mycobacteriales bacterium]
MELVAAYRAARRDEQTARLRRVLSLRAMVAEGMTQTQIADALGISQPAVSQQLRSSPDLDDLRPEVLLEAAAPVLAAVADAHGYTRLAAFGSVARGDARQDSDIDLIVEAPAGTSTFAFIRFRQLLEQILGREIDLISYAGLKPRIDDDIRREAVLL